MSFVADTKKTSAETPYDFRLVVFAVLLTSFLGKGFRNK